MTGETMRTDLPQWPSDLPWHVAHSHFVDATLERGDTPLRYTAFMGAITTGDLGVIGTVTADEQLAYVVCQRDGSKSVPLCRIRAAQLGLDRNTTKRESDRAATEHAAANIPADLSELP